MPEEEPDERTPSQPASSGDAPSALPPERSRRRPLTPEQRRLLGTPRSLLSRPETEKKGAEMEPAAAIEKTEPEPPREPEPQAPATSPPGEQLSPEELPSEQRKTAHAPAAVLPDRKSSRVLEMQNAALIIGGLFVLFLTFYVGRKFDYWKYLIMSREKPKLSETMPKKFAGVPAEDLVEQALNAERSGQWREAAEKLVAAKHKDLAYRGILLRVAKICYDHGDFDNADKLFERAIAFQEDVDTANYFRGMIATRRSDLPAAERFFEAAANAEPLTADYYYYWAEALRLDLHPKEAIPRYEQAALRASREQDEAVCRFKVRMAELEAANSPKISAEIEKKKSAGPLSVDWLMTAAALEIREGHIEEAVQLISQARSAKHPGLFASCVTDMFFRDSSRKNPELARACQLELDAQPTFPEWK